MALRVEVKVLRSIGQHPLYVDETKDWAYSTFDKKVKDMEKKADYKVNSSPNHLTDYPGGIIPVYTTYYMGCPNNLAYWVVRTYEAD